MHNAGTGDDGDVAKFVVVDTPNINGAARCVGVDDAHVVACDGTVGTTIDERASAFHAPFTDLMGDGLVDGMG